jgi:hypothetical protein
MISNAQTGLCAEAAEFHALARRWGGVWSRKCGEEWLGCTGATAVKPVDFLPAQFLGNIIRKVGATIGKKAGPVLRGVARMARRVIGR